MTVIAVVGQIGRDLVLNIDDLPDANAAVPVRRRQEMLGGKGANQAVACRRLGADMELVGVLGTDHAGDAILAQARADGIGTDGVVRREQDPTALLVDLIGPPGVRRLLEDVPPGMLLDAADVRRSARSLERADAVLVQLQQPAAAVLAALEIATANGALIVADGAPSDDAVRAAVLRDAHVVRADTAETHALAGWAPDDIADTVRAAEDLVGSGPSVVALAAPAGADVVAWPDGHVVLPHRGDDVLDQTGAGDAFVAALTLSLLRGESPRTAGDRAADASARTVETAGGRPPRDLG